DTHRNDILQANATDLQRGKDNNIAAALLDRLELKDARIDGLMSALQELAALPEPIGNVVRGNNLPNGIRMQQVRVPLGVVGAIYEARPNVTVDIAGIRIKSGNAVILRGGSAAETTNGVTIAVLREALESQGLPGDLIQGIDQLGRSGADALTTYRGGVEVLITLGGPGLISDVVENAAVSVTFSLMLRRTHKKPWMWSSTLRPIAHRCAMRPKPYSSTRMLKKPVSTC